MRRLLAIAALTLACVCVSAPRAEAREFEVRLLSGGKSSGVWGTKEFQVRVTREGALRRLKLHGHSILPVAALYTSPKPPGSKGGLRVVQGESGNRTLTLKPPPMKTWDEKGKRFIEFTHIIANKRIMEGRPLCRVRQRIVITPTGEISVRYEFEWLVTLRWGHVSTLFFFDQKQCRDKEYMILTGERVLSGRLTEGPIRDRRTGRIHIEQLTIRTDDGPVHLVMGEDTTSSFSWFKHIQMSAICRAAPRGGFIYKGQKGSMSYRILLPVSQQ